MDKNEYKVMNDIENNNWWFVGKSILINTICKQLFQTHSKGRRLLDLGSGTGAVLNILGKYGDAYGTEISTEAIGYLKEKKLHDIVLSDANKPLPLKSNSFTFITCLDVLEHLDNDSLLINEMYRICSPGGYVVITVPAFNILWSYHDEALSHKRRYSKKKFVQQFENLDCHFIKTSYYNFIFFFPILIFRKIRKIISSNKGEIYSDCNLSLPDLVNKLFGLLFRIEIFCLRFLNFPFGVSILLILKKNGK